jgi:hypothetical protein
VISGFINKGRRCRWKGQGVKTILHVVDTATGRAELYDALTTEKALSAWWSTGWRGHLAGLLESS